eukprot:3385842-Prymnesium_polylepis.1
MEPGRARGVSPASSEAEHPGPGARIAPGGGRADNPGTPDSSAAGHGEGGRARAPTTPRAHTRIPAPPTGRRPGAVMVARTRP